MRPNYGGPPVTVGVTLYVLSIGELSEKFMDFTFDMYFRQFWTDPRLSFERSENLEKLVVGAEYIRLIWVPDTFFVNEKIALFHQVGSSSRDKYCHLHINGVHMYCAGNNRKPVPEDHAHGRGAEEHEADHQGEQQRLWYYNQDILLQATCPMNLAYFPFDSQMCTVEIESFGYTMADLKYR